MKKLNVYSVYLDDGKDVFRVTVPAASKKDAAEYVRGNGDVVAIKPADLQGIDLDALADTLKRAQWGQMEIDIITRALEAAEAAEPVTEASPQDELEEQPEADET